MLQGILYWIVSEEEPRLYLFPQNINLEGGTLWRFSKYMCHFFSYEPLPQGVYIIQQHFITETRTSFLKVAAKLKFNNMQSTNMLSLHWRIGGGGARDTPPFPNCFTFHVVFWGKLGKILGWRPLLWKTLDQPLHHCKFLLYFRRTHVLFVNSLGIPVTAPSSPRTLYLDSSGY